MRRFQIAVFWFSVGLCGTGHLAQGFQLNNRWTSTAYSPGVFAQGSPTTISWGFISDGTPTSSDFNGSGPSNLISNLDNWYGAGPGGADLTMRPWFSLFSSSFDRYSSISGLTYIYEPADDGVAQAAGNTGIPGIRGDVRIGGRSIDGSSNILAFNNFPDYGDMVIDTDDGSVFSLAANNFRFFRNTIQHELGHGIGLNHVVSSRNFLMEPFIQTFFDGVQFDDLLGVQRHYGDFYEKSNGGLGNDTSANATALGVVTPGSTVRIGVNGGDSLPVASTEVDFVSIDDDSDTDFYAFTINAPSSVDLALTPVGATYSQGPQGGSQSSFVTSELSDLALTLFDTDGTSVLETQDANGLGIAENITNFSLPAAGTYYARIKGNADQIQLYRLEISATNSAIAGDFNSDGLFDCLDIDALTESVASGTNPIAFDLNGDSIVDGTDVAQWLALAGSANLASQNSYLYGDANLDGAVDGSDFVVWNSHKFTSSSAWCQGNFNTDASIDGQDFIIWNRNKFMSSNITLVPEPGAAVWLVASLLACRRRDIWPFESTI